MNFYKFKRVHHKKEPRKLDFDFDSLKWIESRHTQAKSQTYIFNYFIFELNYKLKLNCIVNLGDRSWRHIERLAVFDISTLYWAKNDQKGSLLAHDYL